MLVCPHISNMGFKIILIYLRKGYHYGAYNISGIYSVLLCVGVVHGQNIPIIMFSIGHLCVENSVGNNRIAEILVSV